MGESIKDENYEKYVNYIKTIGRFLIDNAENMLNDFDTEHIDELNIVSCTGIDDCPTVGITNGKLRLLYDLTVKENAIYNKYHVEMPKKILNGREGD